LVLELQNRYPDARITVLDDFRSGHFRNLRGFGGDVVAADISRLDWERQFGKPDWDAVFHLASITDTTEHNQLLQVHDNVEGFRRLLEFVRRSHTPVVYASSAATYGIASGINREDQPPAPANVYAFSKVQLDNLAARHAAEEPLWKIVGLRYFNVYGPREHHKAKAASMMHQLAVQMAQGRRPRIFKMGEQKRDFVYVKDVVNMTIGALKAKSSVIMNCGSGKPRSFNDVIANLNRVLGLSLETEYIDNPYPFYQPHTEADMALGKQEIGHVPQFSLEQGMDDYHASGFLTLEY
jgi:ADP-L-glycero-D-manno-heptose 6-epimerase